MTTPLVEGLESAVASVGEAAEAILRPWIAAFTERDTAGPAMSEHAPLPPPTVQPLTTWVDGWWSGAKHTPAHARRIGGAIAPWGIVDHTTDMHPDDWEALLRAFTTQPGAGNAATFGVGRTPEQGVVQWCSVFRNANHAGGGEHGIYGSVVNGKQSVFHPNLVTIGIETHNAGELRLVDGAWRWGESAGSGKPWIPHGASFAVTDVIVNPNNPHRGIHKPTDYQIQALKQLHADLELVLAPMPPGAFARHGGTEAVPAWGVPKSPRRVGHVSLDPTNRSDPWSFLMTAVTNA